MISIIYGVILFFKNAFMVINREPRTVSHRHIRIGWEGGAIRAYHFIKYTKTHLKDSFCCHDSYLPTCTIALGAWLLDEIPNN